MNLYFTMFITYVDPPESCKYHNGRVYKNVKLPCIYVNTEQLKTYTSYYD